MHTSTFVFTIMAVTSTLLLSTILLRKWGVQVPAPNQNAVSSLSPKSVNWLGVFAFVGALFICLA